MKMYPETISTQKLLEEFHKLRIELYSRCETISELNAAQDALTLCCETVGLQYVSEHPPEPERQVLIDVSKNKDSIRGGAAMLGSDGIWYWTQDGKKIQKVDYPVIGWVYVSEN